MRPEIPSWVVYLGLVCFLVVVSFIAFVIIIVGRNRQDRVKKEERYMRDRDG